MQKINVNSSPYNKIASVIRELGEACETDIKRKIAQYNKAGGAEALRKLLGDFISNGNLTVRTEKRGNGQSVKFYRLANDKDSQDGHCGDSCINPKINVKFEIEFEGWDNIFALLPSLINMYNSGNEDNAVSTEVDDEDSNHCEVDDDYAYNEIWIPF